MPRKSTLRTEMVRLYLLTPWLERPIPQDCIKHCIELIKHRPETRFELDQNLSHSNTALPLRSAGAVAEQELHSPWMAAKTVTAVRSSVSLAKRGPHPSPRAIQFISRRLPIVRCHFQCKCQCHNKETKLEGGKPGARRSICSSPNCQTMQPRHTKIFVRDATILKKEFAISMITRGFRMSCNIKTRPIVPSSAEAIKCSENGDHETLIKLLITEKASIYDAEPDGWSLLHVSTLKLQEF